MIQPYEMKMSERSESEDQMDIDIKEEFYQLARDEINHEKIPDEYQSTMSQSTKDIPLSLRCRLCAIHRDDTIHIFTSHETEENIAEKIKYCLRIVVKESDNLPKRICWSCLQELRLCYQFNKIVEEADRQFRAFNEPTSGELAETHTDSRPLFCNSHCESSCYHNIDSTDSKSTTIAKEMQSTGATGKNIFVGTSSESSSGLLDPNDTLCANNLITVHEKISSIDEYQIAYSSTSDLNSLRTSALDIIQQTTCASRVSLTSCCRSRSRKQTLSAQCERESDDQGNLIVPGGTDTKKRCSGYVSAGIETEVQTAMTKKDRREACGQTFIAPSDLKLDARRLKKKTDYFCSMCNKSFKHLSTMKIHMTVHSDERPWKCDYCEKSFKTKGHLHQHLTTCKNRPKSRKKDSQV